MKRDIFLLFIFIALLGNSPMRAAAESQTWKLRAGDNLDIIAMTLDIPGEEIRKHNPGISETNLQIGQKLRLPLRSYVETKVLEEKLDKQTERITYLERQNNDLENQIIVAASQLRWRPIWMWGFWIFFSILAFIAAAAYWLFRQTHPQVFDEPRPDRTIKDLKESQIRARSFPYEEQGASSRGGYWHPPLKRLPHNR